MLLWTVSTGSFLLALRELGPDFDLISGAFRLRGERRVLVRVTQMLLEIEEALSAGILPRAERWDALRALPAPWGELAFSSLQELRSSGGAVLPTLKRLRELADEHSATLAGAQSKSSQALAQAAACAGMVPVFGVALYGLLPSVAARPYAWSLACLVALSAAGISVAWMLSMADRARWAGLAPGQRPWVLASQCAGERFLALVRCGTPADLAWTRSCDALSREAPELASAWGHSVFGGSVSRARDVPMAEILIEAGRSVRRAVHLSLMEGKPCTERVETSLRGLRQDLRGQMDRQLALLPTKCLIPLFTLVAPALMGLLVVGLYFEWMASL